MRAELGEALSEAGRVRGGRHGPRCRAAAAERIGDTRLAARAGWRHLHDLYSEEMPPGRWPSSRRGGTVAIRGSGDDGGRRGRRQVSTSSTASRATWPRRPSRRVVHSGRRQAPRLTRRRGLLGHRLVRSDAWSGEVHERCSGCSSRSPATVGEATVMSAMASGTRCSATFDVRDSAMPRRGPSCRAWTGTWCRPRRRSRARGSRCSPATSAEAERLRAPTTTSSPRPLASAISRSTVAGLLADVLELQGQTETGGWAYVADARAGRRRRHQLAGTLARRQARSRRGPSPRPARPRPMPSSSRRDGRHRLRRRTSTRLRRRYCSRLDRRPRRRALLAGARALRAQGQPHVVLPAHGEALTTGLLDGSSSALK